ncbi:MAG: tRNA (adenosine(37)-N6)-dimethylallyltransferase MiaA, partial [Candidatus Moranbacteria bacterium]|nr:tRNA (adenosine(37)-N6)-dimethylallyltransferase MiaA [Candidatus Moranbacteria bacterium]
VLHERIEKRLKKRLEQGMIDEVKRLHEQEGLSWKRLEGFGLEYRWCARFLQGKIPREEMEASLLKDSKYYAKRQMSSLRRLERKGVKIEWIRKNL